MRRPAALLLAAGLAATLATAAEPPRGRHDGRFCVTVAEAAPDCGPVQVDVLRQSRLRVRVADIVYHLELHSSQLDVVLMHGAMQIDGFVAPYEWIDRALRFDDLEKRTRYELTLTR